jgi:carboxymethylenebutenolidase
MLHEETLDGGMRIWSVRPEGAGRHPAMIYMHERYGPVQHSMDVIQRLADNGFVAVAPDMFYRYEGDRGAIERAEARYDLKDTDSLADLDLVMAWLRSQDYVMGDEIGIMGVCQTGREPILYAAHRNDVAAIVIMNGGVYPREFIPVEDRPTSVSEWFPKLSCPVLGLFGEGDSLIPLENIARFRAEMEQARKSYEVHIFRDAPHGWINDTIAVGIGPKRLKPPGTCLSISCTARWAATGTGHA